MNFKVSILSTVVILNRYFDNDLFNVSNNIESSDYPHFNQNMFMRTTDKTKNHYKSDNVLLCIFKEKKLQLWDSLNTTTALEYVFSRLIQEKWDTIMI